MESATASNYALRCLEWLSTAQAPPDVGVFLKALLTPLVKDQQTPETLRKIMASEPEELIDEPAPEVDQLTSDLDQLTTDAVEMPDGAVAKLDGVVSFIDAVQSDESSLLSDVASAATAAVPVLGKILPTVRLAGKVARHAHKLTSKRVVEGTLLEEVPSPIKKVKAAPRKTPDIRSFPKVTRPIGYTRDESGALLGETSDVRPHDELSRISNIWTLHAFETCRVCDYVTLRAFPTTHGPLTHTRRRMILFLHRCEELGCIDPRDYYSRLSKDHWARNVDTPVEAALL